MCTWERIFDFKISRAQTHTCCAWMYNFFLLFYNARPQADFIHSQTLLSYTYCRCGWLWSFNYCPVWFFISILNMLFQLNQWIYSLLFFFFLFILNNFIFLLVFCIFIVYLLSVCARMRAKMVIKSHFHCHLLFIY